jgi:molybdopterin-guanine dinucleotide biosynthesis protein A
MTRTNTVPSLTAAILAGGEGSRFGGADKGFLLLHGKSLIERMLMQLESQADHVLISANRNLEAYACYGHPVIRDQGTGFEGPLAGICAALQAACTEWVLFVPVDAVQLPENFAQRMCAATHQNGSATPSGTVVVHDGVSIIPVACLIHRRLSGDLDAALASGQRSMRDWLKRHQAVEVHFDEHPRAYWSVNTPEELQALEHSLKNTTLS